MDVIYISLHQELRILMEGSEVLAYRTESADYSRSYYLPAFLLFGTGKIEAAVERKPRQKGSP